MVVAPKDGHLYGFDRANNERALQGPGDADRESSQNPFVARQAVHFCPGAVGGAEWNSPAYDPPTNLVLVGEVDWCDTVTPKDTMNCETVPIGQPWTGMCDAATRSTCSAALEATKTWAGWVYAIDADTGVWKWRLKSNYPILGGMTPTAGGVVFFGDVGGNFYALDAATGEKLWGQDLGGAIGGGVITYTAGRYAKGRGGRRLYLADVADEDRDRQGRRPRPRRP